MNIYQMYYANGKKFGFWIRRDKWTNTIAKVISIDGVIEGDNIKGSNPYYKNQKVIAEFYKKFLPENCNNDNIDNISEVSCPGTYTYSMV